MKDGRITQAGKYNDILNSGTDFMELVGAHKEALSSLNAIDAVQDEKESISESDGKSASTSGAMKKEEKSDAQHDKADEPKGQLVQEEEREKGKVGFSCLLAIHHNSIWRSSCAFYTTFSGFISGPPNWKQLLDGLGKSCFSG